jgi:hypothetical protein
LFPYKIAFIYAYATFWSCPLQLINIAFKSQRRNKIEEIKSSRIVLENILHKLYSEGYLT